MESKAINGTTLKMTEDETILLLVKHLRSEGWVIGDDNYCLEGKHGIDITAQKNGKTLLVEVKGARARDNAKTRRREEFDCGQAKNHLGMAMVKVIDLKGKNPDAAIAIAHPNDHDFKKWIGHFIPFINSMGFTHYWVSSDGTIEKSTG